MGMNLYSMTHYLTSIYEDILNNKDNAMKKYEAILLEQPGSIFLAESRKDTGN